MFKVKIFRGSHASTKIFYLEFFINEIFSVKKFPNYSTLNNGHISVVASYILEEVANCNEFTYEIYENAI